MEKKKKNIVIGITSLLLVTLILLGLTYAYYKTRIVGNTSDKSVSVVSKNLSVTYQNESAEISATGIEPGYSATKTFEVKNTGSETVEYSVMLDNVTNTFARVDDWTYTISEGGNTLKSGTLPASTSYILYGESIDAGATKSYTLKINYANLTNVDQSEDMGKNLSFRINISDGLGTTLSDAKEGTLLYAINRDNVVSEPLTVPGRQTTVLKYGEGELSKSQGTVNASSDEQGYYIVYGTGYTFDKESGLYSLTGVTTTNNRLVAVPESSEELYGNYIAHTKFSSIGSSTKEEALRMANTSNLSRIYKITSSGSNSFSYQTKGLVSLKEEAVLATTEDDYGTSYYFRGNVTNNYVNYSGMCWRIVRVQGDGTIKLALADENGECNAETYSTSNDISAFVDGRTDITYKGAISFSAADFSFETSDIPSILSEWSITKNLDTTKLVETEWCNDTAKTSSDIYTPYYGAYDRLYNVSSANPTLKCNTKGMEGTTGIEAKAQKYVGKIALLTADEVVFAGAIAQDETLTYNYYLKTNASGNCYWTMSPASGYEPTSVYGVTGEYLVFGGNMTYVSSGQSVRPSIVLASTVTISSTEQDGTMDNPYVIN